MHIAAPLSATSRTNEEKSPTSPDSRRLVLTPRAAKAVHRDATRRHTRRKVIRHDHPALQQNRTLRFHGVDNDRLLAYSKSVHRRPADDTVLVVVNLSPHEVQSGTLALDLASLGLAEAEAFRVCDLLGGERYVWSGSRNFVRLDPARAPAHIFAVTPCDG